MPVYQISMLPSQLTTFYHYSYNKKVIVYVHMIILVENVNKFTFAGVLELYRCKGRAHFSDDEEEVTSFSFVLA